MYHPSTRLLTILELLQSRGRMAGPELARRLEVSPRSVRRYIAMLQDMGIPVEGERGRYGQYRLRPGYKLPPLMFTDDEALALTLGLLLVRRSGGLVEATTTEAALAKLDRVLPEAVRQSVMAVQDTLVLEVWPERAPPISDKLPVLSSGVRERRRLWLRYLKPEGQPSERDFDPYGVVHRAGLWYVVGYCHLRQDIRVFRLDRIERVELRDEHFEPPADFDALDFVTRSIALLPAQWQVEVMLEMTLEQAQQRISPAMATLEPTQEGVLLRCTTNNLDYIARQLVSFGCPFVISKPDELKDALRELAGGILQDLGEA